MYPGSGSGASYGGGYSNAAPDYDSYRGASSGQYSPGAVGHSYAPSAAVSTSYEAAPEYNIPQPAVERGPASSAGSSSSSGPAFPLYRGNPMRLSPANSGHPGAAFQLGPRGKNLLLNVLIAISLLGTLKLCLLTKLVLTHVLTSV